MIESNLEEIFRIGFITSEYLTTHGGRIDTLGLDENNAPVVIEFKESENENIINQGLFYLAWILDHKGDFEKLVENKIGKTKIDWEEPRLILIAKSYSKYDFFANGLHRVTVELKKYILYENDTLLIENVKSQAIETSKTKRIDEDREMEEEDRKAKGKIVKIARFYDLEYHLQNKNDNIKKLFYELREEIMKLGENIEEHSRKYWISYLTSNRFAIIDIRNDSLKIFIHEIKNDPNNLLKIGDRYDPPVGVWAKTFSISSPSEILYAMSLIRQSYESTL